MNLCDEVFVGTALRNGRGQSIPLPYQLVVCLPRSLQLDRLISTQSREKKKPLVERDTLPQVLTMGDT